MSYYHYTKGCHLPSIVKDGFIKTTKVLLDKNEKSAVWLTKSPVWDSACNIGKIINANKLISGKIYPADAIESITVTDDYMKKEVGMCRILISETIPVITWAKHKHVSGISESMWNAIDTHSRSIGSPVDKWICSFSPIPNEYWEGIEMYIDNVWVKWNNSIPIEDFVELCLSCNGKKIKREEVKKHLGNEFRKKENDFINEYLGDIIEFWKANKHKSGYIEIYITPDYKPYPGGFRFHKKKRIRKSEFKALGKSETDTYALVHFLWEDTFTQYKLALPYELVRNPELEN
jgi:hypothetical protein